MMASGKSAHGVWIGNMNYSTTNKMVLGWLEERGLKEVVRINMPGGKRSGENNRGFVRLILRFLLSIIEWRTKYTAEFILN